MGEHRFDNGSGDKIWLGKSTTTMTTMSAKHSTIVLGVTQVNFAKPCWIKEQQVCSWPQKVANTEKILGENITILVGIIFSVPSVLRKCSSELLRIKTFSGFEELLLRVSLEGE